MANDVNDLIEDMNETKKISSEDRSIYLGLWQTFTEGTIETSKRRDSMNAGMIALNAGIITADVVIQRQAPIIYFIGIALCATWWLQIIAFSTFVKVKVGVLYQLEEKLPFKPFHIEDELFSEEKFSLTATVLEFILCAVLIIYYAYLLIF